MTFDVAAKPASDPYRVLGLERQASDTEIKRAYFQLVRQFPPERDAETFREIRAAYDQLRDPESRARLSLFLLQPPPALPARRRGSYDLEVHREDLLMLAMERLRRPMAQDFCDPERTAQSPEGD